MPNIAIICTLDELTPYSLADPARRYFSLNLSVALEDGPGLPLAAATNVFQPWNLTAISPVVYVDAAAVGGIPAGAIVACSLVASAVVDVPQVKNRLQNRYTAAIAAPNPGYFDWTDEPNANKPSAPGENWSRLLAHASTYTVPVPQNLKLTFVFSVDVHLLNGQTRLFAAPSMVDGANAYSLAAGPQLPVGGTSEWQYATMPAGYAMSAYQAEYRLAALPDPHNLPAPRFIDPNTYWIGTETGADQITPPESQSSEDWRTTLEHRAGEAFDLGQRLLVVLRNLFFPAQNPAPSDPYVPIDQTHPTFAEVDLMRDAILAALRDTADFGLRYAPDGTNLLRFVLQRTPLTPAIDPGPFEAALTSIVPTLVEWKSLLEGAGIAASSLQNSDNHKGVFVAGAAASNPATGQYVRATLDMLESVQTALATDSTLATLLYQQWNQYLSPLPALWTTAVQQAVSSVLTSLTTSRALRKRMLLANIGGIKAGDPRVPVWTALTATPNSGYAQETQSVSANLQALIAGYYRGRFGITAADTYAPLFANRPPAAAWPGGAATPNPDIASNLTTDALNFANTILFPPPANQRTRASHPVIIQIGDTTDQAGAGLTADLERKISGVGLLIREEAAAWTCADFASLYVLNSQTGSFDKLLDNLPVPIRVVTRNKLKQPILIYNNASLVTQDDTDPVSSAFPQDAATFPPEAQPDWDQMFQFRVDPDAVAGSVQWGTDAQGNFTLSIPPYTPPGTHIPPAAPPGDDLSDWKRLPALKFGLNYSFLPFVIGNGGALPPLLASLADPFTPVRPSVFATNWATAITPPAAGGRPALTGYLRTVKYLRRVAVGAPRMSSAGIADNFPSIPPSVVPLARDFIVKAGRVKTSAPPVLLLYNSNPASATSGFSFQLRPPACDLDTWDRWVAGLGASYRNTRISVATGVGRFRPKSTTETQPVNGKTPTPPDLSIDDPAVTSLTFSMTQLYPPPGAGATPPPPATITIPPLAAIGPLISGPPSRIVQTLMATAQSSGITVSCLIGSVVSLGAAGNSVTIAVPQGQVWQISVQADVRQTDQQKFEGPAANSPGGNFSFFIEVAAQGVFASGAALAQRTSFQENLWTNLTASFKSNQLQASLSPWVGVDSDRDLVRNVDLRRQAWRWMGRPIAPLPDDWKAAGTPHVLDTDPPPTATGPLCSRVWEIGSFGERSDDDCAVNQTAINFASPDSTAPVILYSSDLSTDLRARYYRFGIDVHSRYEGLTGFQVVTIRARKEVVTNGPGYTRWTRAILPPRVSAAVPKPKVLLVIPLTEPSSAGSVLPDLLVIANEPFFTIGGLAEELHACLDLARDPSVPLSIPDADANPMPEIGPNPVLSASTLDGSNITFSGPAAPADPLGTTFDQDTAAPLFGNTCFRLKSSMLFSKAAGYLGALPPGGLEHFEARVRFTRIINGVPFGIALPNLESKPTDPFPVEFQSSFVHVATTTSGPVPIDDSLRFSIAGGKLGFTSNNVGVTPQAGPPASPQLELWGLVMRTISDVTGAEQTYPVDILGPGLATAIPDSKDLVVYLLEVLCSPGNQGTFVSGIANARNILFPDPQTGPDAKARINRCSPQIRNQASQ